MRLSIFLALHEYKCFVLIQNSFVKLLVILSIFLLSTSKFLNNVLEEHLYILDTNPLLVLYVVNIFPNSGLFFHSL